MKKFYELLWSGFIVWTPVVSTPLYYLTPDWKPSRIEGQAVT